MKSKKKAKSSSSGRKQTDVVGNYSVALFGNNKIHFLIWVGGLAVGATLDSDTARDMGCRLLKASDGEVE